MVAYVQMLSDIPLNVLDAVCRKAINEYKFLPSIAEIVASCRSMVDEKSDIRVKTWAEAQREIQKGIMRTWFHGCLGEAVSDELYGKPCEPKWSTEEIRMTVETYGFDNLCRTLETDMPIVWSQLRKIYEQICQRRHDAEINNYVLGGDGQHKLLDMTKKIGKM